MKKDKCWLSSLLSVLLFLLCAQAVAVETEWERNLNELVERYVRFWYQVYPMRGNSPVTQLVQGQKYRLYIGVANDAADVHFDKVELTLAGYPRVQFYTDSSFKTPVSEVKVTHEDLGKKDSQGATKGSSVYFIAKATVNKAPSGSTVAPVLFGLGLYAQPRPEGHYWEHVVW